MSESIQIKVNGREPDVVWVNDKAYKRMWSVELQCRNTTVALNEQIKSLKEHAERWEQRCHDAEARAANMARATSFEMEVVGDEIREIKLGNGQVFVPKPVSSGRFDVRSFTRDGENKVTRIELFNGQVFMPKPESDVAGKLLRELDRLEKKCRVDVLTEMLNKAKAEYIVSGGIFKG